MPSSSRSDPLTIAYMAMGAQTAIKEHPEAIALFGEGELELVDAVIRHAEYADRLAERYQDDIQEVFVYEVAEPLGQFIVERVVAQDPDLDRVVRRRAEYLMSELCGCTIEPPTPQSERLTALMNAATDSIQTALRDAFDAGRRAPRQETVVGQPVWIPLEPDQDQELGM